jgi:glycosyltransferase involved in cell wall biosynthesis
MLMGEQKYAALRSASVCVIPSRSDVRSLVALEAMASGLPLVISEKCLFPEVERGGMGYEVELDPRKIAAGIRGILDAPEVAAEMGKRGRIYVASQLTWERSSARMINAYNGILEKCGRPL